MECTVNNTNCCVPQCTSHATKNPAQSFHKFPDFDTEFIRRQEWIRNLRIGKKVTEYMKVCSKHFKPTDYFFPDGRVKRHFLKKNAVPSQCLPVTTAEKPIQINKEEKARLAWIKVEQDAKKKIKQNINETNQWNPVSTVFIFPNQQKKQSILRVLKPKPCPVVNENIQDTSSPQSEHNYDLLSSEEKIKLLTAKTIGMQKTLETAKESIKRKDDKIAELEMKLSESKQVIESLKMIIRTYEGEVPVE